MTHDEIMATERKIAYVNNTGDDMTMFDAAIMAAVHADTTSLPEEIADLLSLSYVRISPTENRAILNWA